MLQKIKCVADAHAVRHTAHALCGMASHRFGRSGKCYGPGSAERRALMAMLVLVAALPVVLASCRRSQPEVSDPAVPIEAQAGDSFTVVLEANQTTGYHWQIVSSDQDLVKFVRTEYVADVPALIGSGGVEVWTFEALRASQTQIVLGYFPPGNASSEPEETATFTVIVT